MSTTRTAALVGSILLAVSGVLALGFIVTTSLSEPDTGANVGGGAMMLAATPLATAGVITLIVCAAMHLTARRKAGGEPEA